MKRSFLVGVGLALIAGAAYAATQAVPPASVMGLPKVPAPQVVQQAAPVVTQACSSWLTLWPAIKENLFSAAAMSGMASVLAMLLPQAQAGTPYGILRQVIDLVALNMRNAANEKKV